MIVTLVGRQTDPDVSTRVVHQVLKHLNPQSSGCRGKYHFSSKSEGNLNVINEGKG